MGNNFDDLFMAYAEKQEEEAARPSNGGGFTRDYEQIKWCGLEANKPRVIRVMGGPPNSKLDKFTAKTVTISWLVGDDGKRFKVVKPSLAEDPNYFVNKIISKVNSFSWVNKTKVYPCETQHPDIYKLVNKNGLDETDPRAKFERGWKGSDVLIMNMIDRQNMGWHRENKHSMLLAKSVNPARNGDGEYVSEGISAYGVGAKLNHLFMSYGSWEKYDIAITKTGTMQNPFNVVNASHSPMEVDKSVRSFISNEDHLTDEEKSWERYDLEKLFGYTTATKFFNRMKDTLKRIDAALGTRFYEEISDLSEKEKDQWKEIYGDENANAPLTENKINADMTADFTPNIEGATVAPRERARKAVVTEAVEHAAWMELPHPEFLTDEQKAMVLEVTKDASGKVTAIKWNCKDEDLAMCPDCGVAAPYVCKGCPVCGLDFEGGEEIPY